MKENKLDEWLKENNAGSPQEAADRIGVELRGEEGHPYHCGTHMRTYSGIAGTDYAKCETCGASLRNLMSPHVNGGLLFTDEVYAAYPHGAWVAEEGGER